MSNAIDEGGSVFSVVYRDADGSGTQHVQFGISRRDWLAAMAMQGFASAARVDKESMHPKTALEIARDAYHLADVMIKVGKESGSQCAMPQELIEKKPVAVALEESAA